MYFRHYLSITVYEKCCSIALVLRTLTDTDRQCSKLLINFGCDLKARLEQPLPLTPQSLISALLHLAGVMCSNNCHYSVYCNNCPSHLLLFLISTNYWQLIFLHCFFFIAFTIVCYQFGIMLFGSYLCLSKVHMCVLNKLCYLILYINFF